VEIGRLDPFRPGIRRLFRIGIRRRRFARAEAEDELRAYVRARVDDLVARGYSPADAHAEAIRRLGGSYEETLSALIRSAELRDRHMEIRDYFSDLRDDVRFAARSFSREKAFAAFIVVTLALGIGANAAMFGVIDRLLLRGPEHVVDARGVVRIYRRTVQPVRGEVITRSFGWVTYELLRARKEVFANVAAYSVASNGQTFGAGANAAPIPVGSATWDLFPLLGVRPHLGRFFDATEDSPSPQRVVVLGFGLWRRAFGGDPDVIGKSMTLGTVQYRIVGVAPRAFTGPDLSPVDAWVPLSLRSQTAITNWRTGWNGQWLWIVARTRADVSPAHAAALATATYRGAYTGNEPGAKEADLFLKPLRTNARGDETAEVTISRWLIGVTMIVLLIACSNVTNLLLARTVKRRREVAVRIALGAGRGRLARLLLTESTLLALAGAAAGLLVAWGTAILMRRVLLPGLEWPSAPIDWRVLAVSLVVASAVGLLTGLLPAVQATSPDLTVALKTGTRDGGGRSSRVRAGLTLAQAALSMVLLVGAGLFLRSLARVQAIDLGIEPDRVLVVQVRYPSSAGHANPAEDDRRRQVLRDAMARARVLGPVENASLTVGLPFQSSFGMSQRIAGMDSIPPMKGGNANLSAVSDGYFETVGTRIIEGRAFGPADRAGSEPVAIVSRTMAKALWPNRSPLGECIYWGGTGEPLDTCSRIVGVAADANSYRLREDPHMHYYIPFGQEHGFGGTSLLVRPRHGAEKQVAAAMRRLLVDIDPSISFVQGTMLQESIDPQVRPWRLGAAMFTLLGVLALVVAAVGVYSVMSYLVAQRSREIGVRIALGAQSSNIVSLVLRGSVSMAAGGLAIGLVVALLAGRLIEPLLFETSARDPLVLVGVAATLLLVAALASAVPALRAKRVDPIEALRGD
jgi:predicted permease